MLSEEQLRDVLAIREHTAKRMERCQEEMDTLEKEAALLDEMLKQSSFARASSLPRSGPAPGGGQDGGVQDGGAAEAPPAQGPEPVSIMWKEKQVEIGSARVTPERVYITLNDSVSIDAQTPPLMSFFVGKVIGGMRKKDSDDGVAEPIECAVGSDGGAVRSITVTGYRDPARVREIINTAEWSLNRMLERAAG